MNEDTHKRDREYLEGFRSAIWRWKWDTDPQQIGQPLTPDPELNQDDELFLKSLGVRWEKI